MLCGIQSVKKCESITLFYDNINVCFASFSLKMDCEKLVQEKTEMQRHYVMVKTLIFALKMTVFIAFFCLQYYEMSYGLNVEMHKQVKNATRD